jgi:hypothetical protein
MKKIEEFFQKREFLIFCLIAVLNAVYVFSFNIYHTLDGPGHLHNSNLLLKILSGDELINAYYRINPIPDGNWTGIAVLAIFNTLFPATKALSFFLFTYFLGMAFSYRYLIKSVAKTFHPVNYIIFPFFDNSCLSIGLYNFSTSLIVLFIILGFWIRNYNRMNAVKWIGFSLLLIFLYFSHFLSFVFFGICLISFIIYDEVVKYFQLKKIDWISMLNRVVKIALAALPTLVLALIYVLSISSTVASGDRDDPEEITLLQNFFYVRPLILFHVENDGTRNIILFIGIMILFILAALRSIFYRKQLTENKYNRNYIFILLIVFTTMLVFLPSRFLLHTMRIRLALMFFIFFVTWIGLYRFPKWFQLIAAVFFMGITISNKAYFREIYDRMDKYASEIHALNQWIEPNSIVLPIHDTYMWMHPYNMSYIGVDKPIINTRNTQAFGFFNVIFKNVRPFTMVGNKVEKELRFWFYSGSDTSNTKIVDYVLLSNPKELLKEKEKNAILFNTISTFYTKIVATTDSNLILYKLNDSVDVQAD